MTASGDYPVEMRTHRELSERDVEDLFAGRDLPGEELLTSFAQTARALATGAAPLARGELARILAGGLDIDKGDLPVTAASKAAGPRREASGLPKWRKPLVATSSFLTAIFTKVGMASAAAKAGLTAAVAAGALTAAGAAGALPAPAQNALSQAISAVTPIQLPTSGTSHGKPTTPGLNGLDRANNTPAAGHAPTSLPTPGQSSTGQPSTGQPSTETAPAAQPTTSGPPASPGAQSATGLAQANSTPAAGHAPTSVPTPTNPGSQAATHPSGTSSGTAPAPPATPGAQSSAGLSRTTSAPAAGKTPSPVPAPASVPVGSSTTGASRAGAHTSSVPTR